MRVAFTLLCCLVGPRAIAGGDREAQVINGVVTLTRGASVQTLAVPCEATAVLLRATLLVGCADGRLIEYDVRGTPRIVEVKRAAGPVISLTPTIFDVCVTITTGSTDADVGTATLAGDCSPQPARAPTDAERVAATEEEARLLAVLAPARPAEGQLRYRVGGVLMLHPFSIVHLGALLSLVVDWRAAFPFAVRAALTPLGGYGALVPGGRAVGSYGGVLEAGLDTHLFGLGVGVGFGRAEPSGVFTLGPTLRVGAVDGLNLVARAGLRFVGTPLQNADGVLTVPLGPIAVIARGTYRPSDTGVPFDAELGLRIPVDRDKKVSVVPTGGAAVLRTATVASAGIYLEVKQ